MWSQLDQLSNKVINGVNWTSPLAKSSTESVGPQYAFEVEPGDMTKKTIEVTVWDKRQRQRLIHWWSSLKSQSKGDRLRHWLDVMENPNRRIERWHPLSNVVFID
ncbi:hypothetical protein CEXT_592361 [Caerostris extrusa]|uniref:Uncharacterized protein n=1 Tax=Caerostris extrusa TaxID=172846 RepID=A0AAV4UW88_CAEEX|nr:hypothetical protein CEXT_592361 [Caerostris extrusa]